MGRKPDLPLYFVAVFQLAEHIRIVQEGFSVTSSFRTIEAVDGQSAFPLHPFYEILKLVLQWPRHNCTESDCFSSRKFDTITVPLAAEGQCGPQSLKETSSGKVHFYYLKMVIKRERERKKRGVGDIPFT